MKKLLFYVMLALALAAALLVVWATVARADQVNLKMDSRNGDIDGFRIYMRRQGQGYDYSRPAWTGKVGFCTIKDLEPGVTYYFVARVFRGNLQSADSNEVRYTAVDRRPPKTTGIDLSNH